MTVPAVIPKTLFKGQATAAGATIYTTPATTTGARITAISIHNFDASPHTFSLYAGVSSISLNNAHTLYKDVAIATGASIVYIEPRAIGFPFTGGPALGFLAIKADADSVLDVGVFGSEIDMTSPTVGRAGPNNFFMGVLSGTPGVSTIYGESVGGFCGVQMSLNLCNVDSSPHDVTVALSLDGGSSYTILKTVTVPANDTLVVTDEFIVGPTGGTGLEILTAYDDGTGFITAANSVVRVNVNA